MHRIVVTTRLYFLPPKADWTVPPMLPSVVNCLLMAPSLSSGPPIFCAVPPMAPCSARPWSVAVSAPVSDKRRNRCGVGQ